MKYILFFILTFFLFADLLSQQKVAYFNHTQVIFLIGEESEDNLQKATIPSFQTINGIRIGDKWGLGIGIGADPLEYKIYPVFGSIHYFFINLKHNPFLAIKLGHAFTNSNKKIFYDDFDHKGGLMFNPEVGVRLKIFDFEMTLSGGYRFQRLKSDIKQQGAYIYQREVEYNRISFALGVLF